MEVAPITIKEAKTSKFGLFYKHKDEESYLVSFICKYCLVDIQYIQDIKKNKFKPENIMKLSTSIKRIKKVAKSLKISISGLEIKAKEDNYTTPDAKSIILLFCVFHIYTQILIFLVTLGIKLQFHLALRKYPKHLMML